MKFSIIIPNYNSREWIEKCLNSVLNQTFKDYELIVVDDMSTDGSDAIAYDLLRNKGKMIFNKTKRLNGGTRNAGVAEANGEYLIFMDCDDWLVDFKVLEDINNKLNNNEDVMYLGYTMSNEENNPLILNIKDKKEAFFNPFAAPWLKVIKRELCLKVPFPEGTLFEDRIHNYELVLNMKTFSNLGRATHYWNRQNENSITFDPKWKNYRFEYCGELYRLIKEIEDKEFKEYLKNELKGYLDSCNKMVEEL